MPSTHFGVALVVLIYTFKYYRNIAWLLLPIVIGLAVGTVWGRFHYVSDVVVGGLIGVLTLLIVWKFYDPQPHPLYNDKTLKEYSKENVS